MFKKNQGLDKSVRLIPNAAHVFTTFSFACHKNSENIEEFAYIFQI